MTDLEQEKEICQFSAVTNRERPSSVQSPIILYWISQHCSFAIVTELHRECSEKMIIGFTECRIVKRLVLSFQVLL